MTQVPKPDSSGGAGLSRRIALGGGMAVALVPTLSLPTRLAQATSPDDPLASAIKAITKGAKVLSGRVKLVMPELAENGNSVALTVTVDSPMTTAEHVRVIHVLSEKNPVTHIARFHLGPRAGRARISTNIRLATTQIVTGLAEMSDGSFWSGTAEVVVTLAACLDGG